MAVGGDAAALDRAMKSLIFIGQAASLAVPIAAPRTFAGSKRSTAECQASNRPGIVSDYPAA
jgi:hypothetical protein